MPTSSARPAPRSRRSRPPRSGPSSPATRPSSTSARHPSGSRATCPTRSTSARATSSSRSRTRSRTGTRRSSCTAPAASAPCSRPRPSSSSATRTSPRCRAASRPGSRPGLPWEAPVVLSADQKQRYSRHLLIPEVGAAGQQRLLESKALLIGAGGLGSPAALYLAAAGVGTIGIVDFDVVDLSNLQRQILHTNDRVGERKVESARKTINALNPDVNVVTHEEMLVADNVDRIIPATT